MTDGRLAPIFLRFPPDDVGAAFLLLTVLLWGVAGAFAVSYHRTDADRGRFFTFFLLTLAGNLGVVLAGDLLTFYLTFAVMTFAAYGLVVHDFSQEAFRAGRIYIILALVGETAILTGILALGGQAEGGLGFGTGLSQAWSGLSPEWPGAFSVGAVIGSAPAVATLFLVGFGVKAGLVPLHLWLPLAHPVAPAAASALLSGAMIKAGLLGWVRVLPTETGLPALGGTLLILGVATAFYGVVVGLAQDNAKTVLAYSSISQMGYMALAVGIFLLDPGLAPAVLLAVGVFAVHHGLAKGALFLSAGIAGRASSAWNRRWVVPAAALPALCLSGAPFTSGTAAKSALKLPLGEVEGGWYSVLSPLLLLAAAGTTLLMVRFLVLLGRSHGADPRPAGMGLVAPWALLVGMSAFLPIWLPWVIPGLPGSLAAATPTSLKSGLESLLPVVLGALAGLLIMKQSQLLGPVQHWRVPAGDLLVFLERALQGRSFPTGESFQGAVEEGERAVETVKGRLQRWMDAVEADAPSLTRGPVLGGLFLLFLTTLAAALLLGAG